jgi:hypothetical protein
VTKLYQQLGDEKTINNIIELENQIAFITNAKRAISNYKKVIYEKEKEKKDLKGKQKIPHFQFT